MSQGVQIRLQKTFCPVFKGFCRPKCAWQNPFCQFRVLPAGSGVLPRTLAVCKGGNTSHGVVTLCMPENELLPA